MSMAISLKSIKWAVFCAIPLGLAGCIGGDFTPSSRNTIIAPALEVLALDFERTNFSSASRVSGRLAKAQRGLLVSTATSGRLRERATGPIPTEVRVDVTELVTSGNTVRMRGKLAIRDLAFGEIMAELDDFSASGVMPVAPRGAGAKGLVFRGIEEEVLAWLSGLECNTATRRCGKPQPKPIAADGEDAADVPLTEDGDIELASLVGPRPTSTLRKLNTGGIRAEKVIAAAAPVVVENPGAGVSKIGTTVAALGLLDRSGFWLQTPLVSTESTGFVQAGNGKRIAVTLVPKAGPSGGGSQLSLAAMTELGAQVTDLVTLEVFR